TDHVAWLRVEDGDLVVVGGRSGQATAVVVDQDMDRLDLVDSPQGWARVDILPTVQDDVPGGDWAGETIAGGLGLLLVIVLLLVLRRALVGTPAKGTVAAASSRRSKRARLAPVILAAMIPVSLIGTWPMVVARGALVQRNFDGFGSSWLLWSLSSGVHSLPRRLDTVAFALVGGVIAQLTDAVTAYHLATILGVALSFAAAAVVADRVLDAGRLGAVVAGVAYALCPLAGTALAEGHGGWLLGPGLPLLIGALLSHDQRRPWRDALFVVLAGLLCAVQSGYVAVMAGITVVVLSIATRRWPWRVLVLGLPLALAYGLAVLPDAQGDVAGARSWDGLVELASLLPSSDVATLDTLLGQPPGAGLLLHHARHALGFSLIAGGLVLPLLRRDRVGLSLAALGGVGLALALGPSLILTCAEGSPTLPLPLSLPLPYRWMIELAPPLALFRFPVRFLWLWVAAAALGTGRSVGWLARGDRLAAGLLAAGVIAETLLVGARPFEARTTLASVPSAYQVLHADDVVYDLWPLHAPDHPLSLELKELSCFYQVAHGASSPIPCLDVEVDRAELYRLDRGLAQLLVSGAPAPRRDLAALKITAVAWHRDAFSPELQERVGRTLRSWFGQPSAESTDHGEAIVLWRLHPDAP
ncbi:MAG: hypothetical protein GXP62_00005, partial [Oligoflexia bacterium]|nr:hypothetical protein [Oligoflexia bacterium]